MSIPPLVCSTPPPPDQCEEDKDPDDFDIPYNLSQDEDDGFGYGDFTSYNHYESNSVVQNVIVSTNEQEISNEIIQSDITLENQSEGKVPVDLIETNTTNEIKPKTDEDTNIEDLCLEVNEESISSNEKEDEHSETDTCNVENSQKVLKVDANGEKSSTISEESAVDTSKIEHCGAKLDDEKIDDPSLDTDVQSSEPTSSSNDEAGKNYFSTEDNSDPIKEPTLDDDFGDFDEFQYANLEIKTSHIIENCDSPWDTNKADDNDDFGNFTANFDSIERSNSPLTIDDSTEFKIDRKDTDNSPVEEHDDDFGDFDDFKSSAVENEADIVVDSDLDQQLPILNFHASDSEHQVMESLTNVLTSIFEVEISEPENEFEGKLESMLSETWGHLRETDVRQPYIINWNNSLGQKTLLKALCIDSRNILFGPKWGYNMPKYAVNLSTAPLQPQKPLTSTNPPQNEAVSNEKAATKPGGWTDPFTAEGQESCNTENESVVEVTSTDLDVFEATISTKSDKIYSSTLNVQPLRQISLPDTHIFTPTDSETPTSKTVHYDSGPPILLPQTVLESGKTSETNTTEHTNDTPKDDDDDDYWEFQGFKSSSEKTVANTALCTSRDPPLETKIDNAIKPNVTYQTQVLQPIKMEPLMPTVNWPDPGEIKETFDDFTDFASNSTWNDKSQEQDLESNVLEKINDKHKNIDTVKETPRLNSKEEFDDDFNTFQSALPPNHIISEVKTDSLGSNTLNIIPSQNLAQIPPDFNNTFPKNNIGKSETISINPIRPNYGITSNQGNPSNTTEFLASKSVTMLGNQTPQKLLQPTTNTNLPSSQNKQKTGQILQPLSLESYSQINWPNPGIDLQDLSRFNPVENLQSLKSDLSVGGPSKVSTPVHNQKNVVNNQVPDDDIWGDFVSSKPKQQATLPKKPAPFVDEDEWTDFVSSPSVKPQNGLNTISLNVHTNSNVQKSSSINKLPTKNNQLPLDIPTLNYITPKASGHRAFNDRHFQNL